MNYQYYTVVSGDSLWGIATKFGLSVNELMALNGMTSTNQIIHPGDRLIVGKTSQPQPDPEPTPGGQAQYYTVVAGDSLWGIANKFGLTVNELTRMNNMTSNSVIHPGDVLIVSTSGGGGNPLPNPDPTPQPTNGLEKVVQWFRDRIGKVKYSQDLVLRQGPNFYDCSSAVYAALMYAGFLPEGHKGNTGSLFQLEGTLFTPISRSQVRFGDIFIIGTKGVGTHTGVFTSYSKVVHSINEVHDMKETDFDGWVGPGEQHFYRIVGAATPNPDPTPNPNPNPTTETTLRQYSQSGRFTANRRLVIGNQPRANASAAAYLEIGESVYIDSIYETNKFKYVSYMSYSGVRRYVPVAEYKNGSYTALYGTLQ